MSNQNPWGNVNPDANGSATWHQTGSDAGNNAGGYWTPGSSGYGPGGPTGSTDRGTYPSGLGASVNTGHTWGLTDLWGGDNKYADWSLTPANFMPQGDSASFYDSLAHNYAAQNAGQIAGAQAGARNVFNMAGQNTGQSLQMLQNAAAGNAPSQAQIQQQQGIQQSIAAQQALASSSRGGPGAWAAANRNAAVQGAQTQQSAIQQGAALRAQEMATARGQYAQASNQAGQLGAEMGQYGTTMEQQRQAAMLGLLGYGQAAGQISNAQENAWNNIVSGATTNNAGNASNATGSTLATIGTLAAAASDVRVKSDIQDESPRGAYEPVAPGSASEEMLSKIHPYSFNYKPGIGEDPDARHFGVMAQDLERSRMGSTLVRDTPIGKHIDVTHAMGAALAGMADLNARLQRIEGKRG